MLRPALLLPPRRRPLTPRSGKKSLPFFLGPAIGLSGDYPSGTLTRRFGAARFRTLPRLRALACGRFRTHHARSLPRAVVRINGQYTATQTGVTPQRAGPRAFVPRALRTLTRSHPRKPRPRHHAPARLSPALSGGKAHLSMIRTAASRRARLPRLRWWCA